MYLNDDIIEMADTTMYSLVDTVIKLDIDEIDDYAFPQDEAFGLQIIHHGELYCFIIRFSSTNKNFMCMGPGAHARDQKTSEGKDILPPFFVRWKWYNYFEESVIAYADPVMFHDDEITLTWFCGNKDYWPLEDVATIIKKLAINQGVINENIMFFGSSGGGFASVMLGALIKKSKVLVNNPQFFILSYYKTHVDKLFDLILFKEYDGLSHEEIIDKIKYRMDSIELFKREKYAPPITCYINIKSPNDMECQIYPFINQYYKFDAPKNLNVIYYTDPTLEKAHNPLPTPETIEVINEFSENYLNNTDESIKSNEGLVLEKRKVVSNLTEKVSELDRENTKLNKLNEKYKKKISGLKWDNKKLDIKVNSLRNTNNKLKNEIETRKKTIRRQDSLIRWLKKQNSHFQSTKAYKVWQTYAKIKNILKRSK